MDKRKYDLRDYKNIPTRESLDGSPKEPETPEKMLIFLRNELKDDKVYMTEITEAYKKAKAGNPKDLLELYKKYSNTKISVRV